MLAGLIVGSFLVDIRHCDGDEAGAAAAHGGVPYDGLCTSDLGWVVLTCVLPAALLPCCPAALVLTCVPRHAPASCPPRARHVTAT